MRPDLAFSRPLATAQKLGDLAPEKDHFLKRSVLLTGESKILLTANGSECFLSSLRLLIRICPNVSAMIPPELDDLKKQCEEIAADLGVVGQIAFLAHTNDHAQYDAILNIGSKGNPCPGWTVINSNGWLARVSSQDDLSDQCDQENPIGALAAASLGVSEVFKRLINLKPSRGGSFNALNFNFYNYSSDTEPGPALSRDLNVDLGIVGAGAIGSGIVYLLSRLPIKGNLWIVDAQKFAEENYGTCFLIGPGDVGKPKAVFAETILKLPLSTKGYHEEFSTFKQRLGNEIRYPKFVVNGLDNIPVRHEVQNLWPDLILDGAISDFACQVSRHPWHEDSACLICLFREPSGPPAEKLASQATGLTEARIRAATETDAIKLEDVKTAPIEKQSWLRERVGKPLCSVVSEGVIQEMSQDQSQNGFAPSVPFVACLSACMVLSELIKAVSGETTVLETRFQFDVLRGPMNGQFIPQTRRKDCICVTRSKNIEKVRKDRLN